MALASLILAAADVLGCVTAWWVYSLGMDSLMAATQDWMVASLGGNAPKSPVGAVQQLGSSRQEMMTTKMLRNSYRATPSL